MGKKQSRLIYKSVAAENPVSNEAIRGLLATSSKNNQEAGITGLLLLSGNRFLQVLEGPPEPVNALFQKISRDPRHHTVELVQYKDSTNSCFEEWSMRLVDLYDLTTDQRKILMDKYEHADGEIEIPKEPELVLSLLFDARAICLSEPWSE